MLRINKENTATDNGSISGRLIAIVLFIVLCGLISLLPVGNADAETLTITTSGTGTGMVGGDYSVGSHTVNIGDSITLTATPDASSDFDGWSGSVTDANNSITFTVASDMTIDASFTLKTVTLTVVDGGGTGSGTTSPTVGTHTYDYGDVVTLTATPAVSSDFQWSGTDTGGLAVNTNDTITMNGDQTVTVTYTLKTVTLTVNIVQESSAFATATGTPTATPATGGIYTWGDVVALAANPDDPAGMDFQWSGTDGSPALNADANITMNGDQTVTVSYTLKDVTLTVNTTQETVGAYTASGTPSPATGSGHKYYDVVSLIANPDISSDFQWSGTDGAPGLNVNDTITMDGSKTVSVDYTLKTVTLTVNEVMTATAYATPTGSSTPASGSTYTWGTTVPVTASTTADTDYQWSGTDGTPALNTNDSITMVGDQTVTVTFTFKPVTLTINSSGTGTGTPSASGGPFVWHDVVSLSANPHVCSDFQWSGTDTAGLAVNTDDTITMDGDQTVSVVYTHTDKTLTLSVSESNGATGSSMVPDPATSPLTVTCGEYVALSAIPGDNAVFSGWTGDVANSTLADTSILMDSDKTVVANFDGNYYVLSLAKSGEGSVTAVPGGSVGVHNIIAGEVVALNAVPAAGWNFDHWAGAVADSNSSSTTVTMDSDNNVTAYFTTTLLDPDVDNDGDGYSINGGDCNDADASIHPGAPEVCGDGIDQDCNGLDVSCTVDNDGDGYTGSSGDCNDNDASINPGATEICGDGTDQNCDGSDLSCDPDDTDSDGDGYSPNMGDCNDLNDTIYPGATEICGDGVDNDCYDGDRPCGVEETCVLLSDNPVETQIQAAPANIMFLLDDSGSMAWTYMTKNYATPYGWKALFSGINTMYYDPASVYRPWPNHLGTGDLPNANMNTPRRYPVTTNGHISSSTYDMNANPYFSSVASSTEYITVRRDDWGYLIADSIRLTGVAGTPTEGISFTVDNTDVAFNGGSLTTWGGPWLNGNASIDYWNTMTWYLTVPVAGQYNVEIYMRPSTDWTRDARYSINSGGAEIAAVHVNQRLGSIGWRTLGGPYTLAASTTTTTSMPYTSYFAWNDDDGDGNRDNDEIYLVALDGDGTAGTIRYYRVDSSVVDSNNNVSNASQLTPVASPPAGIVTGRTYLEERQNFVNWFQYYRTRDMAAKAAVGRVIDNMENVNIGLHTIWDRVHQPVLAVEVPGETDQTDTLLTTLYNNVYPSGGTPLRRGFQRVGQYFDADDGVNPSLGSAPYAAAADGGGCQQNFAIVMTDGDYNGSDPDPYMGNKDGDNNSLYDGGVFADSGSKTLADIAMHYYERDLSSALPDLVPETTLDPATHQHMVSYMISFGVFGTIDQAAYANCPIGPAISPLTAVCPTWPNLGSYPANATAQEKIDDMYHAAVNGRGKFITTGSPQELVDALDSILNDIEERIGSGSSVSINSQELQTGTTIFQGIYDTTDWSGTILAYELDTVSGALSATYKWSAREQLDLLDWDTGRRIISYDGTDGIPFRLANIPAAQLTLLDADAGVQSDIIDYIRGDGSNEQGAGGTFRSRSSKLGDIVHSTPLLRNGVLFVGGNDGMLHAFSEATGQEIFAYVPRLVYGNLANLTTPHPGFNHKFYVDQAPYIATVGTQDLLVGTLGKGGKGVYCLDVTDIDTVVDPEVSADLIAKWEYPNPVNPGTDPDDDLGYGYSRAFIVDTNINQKVVVLGNGYESTNQKAVLYVIDATSGAVLKKIDTGVGDATNCNGLSTPTLIDVNNDRKVDYAYAGDLLGNLWKFDLTSNDYNNWSVYYTDGTNPQPLFQARSQQKTSASTATSYRQPITMQPDVIRRCGGGNNGGYQVFFGTGRYLGDDDFLDVSVQTLYSVWDWADAWIYEGYTGTDKYLGSFTNGSPRQLSNLYGNGGLTLKPNAQTATLLQQTQIFSGSASTVDGSVSGNEYRVLSDNSIDWYSPDDDTGSHVGWYFDLPATSERAVQDVSVRDYILNAISTIPSSSPCGAGGNSMIMYIDACGGGQLDQAFLDINGDGKVNSKDMVNIGSDANPIWVVPSGVKKTGITYSPAVISLGGGLAQSYFSNSAGSIQTETHADETKGIFLWKEIE